MNNKKTDLIVDRILRQRAFSLTDLLEGKIEPTDLQSLLLKLYENLALRTSIKAIARQYETNRFMECCTISQRELLKFDHLIYGVIPENFSAIELSPVNPLGTNSVLSKVSQKNVLSTVRNVEVIADVTTALALECAKLRKQLIRKNPQNTESISLCSSHRSIRLQQFAKIPGFTSHFRVFGACTTGKDTGHEKFESENLIRHISIYLDLLERVNQNGYYSDTIVVSISDIRITETLISLCGIKREDLMLNTQTKGFNPFSTVPIQEIALSTKDIPIETVEKFNLQRPISLLSEIEMKALKELRKKHPKITFQFDLNRIAGIGYYENLCFKITAKNKQGNLFPLADGGLTDWTKKLLASKKERLFTSGFGSELFCKKFKA